MGTLSTRVNSTEDDGTSWKAPCLMDSFVTEDVQLEDVIRSMATTWIDINDQHGVLEVEAEEVFEQVATTGLEEDNDNDNDTVGPRYNDQKFQRPPLQYIFYILT